MDGLRAKFQSIKLLLTLLGILVIVLCYQLAPDIKDIVPLFKELVSGVVYLVAGYNLANVGVKAVRAKLGTAAEVPNSPSCPTCNQPVEGSK